MKIQLHPLPGLNMLTETQVQYLQKGVAEFEYVLKDDVVLHIGVTLLPFHLFNYPTAFQAAFIANKLPMDQAQVYKLLTQDAKTQNDTVALKSLKKYSASVDFLSLGYSKEFLDLNVSPVVYKNKSNHNKIRLVPSANLKAIDPHFKFDTYGDIDAKFVLKNNAKPILLDGIILLNSTYPFKFSPTNTDNKAYDARAVFNHEMLGILGLQSAVLVTIEENAMPKCADSNSKKCFTKTSFAASPLGSIIDLFRYSKKSAELQIVDWSITHQAEKDRLPYFSIDGGITPLMYFSFGATNTREQAGLWITPSILKQMYGEKYPFPFNVNAKQFGLNSPLHDPSFEGQLSDVDRISLDVIGWDL